MHRLARAQGETLWRAAWRCKCLHTSFWTHLGHRRALRKGTLGASPTGFATLISRMIALRLCFQPSTTFTSYEGSHLMNGGGKRAQTARHADARG